MSLSAVKEQKAQIAAQPRANAESLITKHLDLWTGAITSKSTTGRGSNKKIELYGIKKLRELILELAVRGKLVPQDLNDESATQLLKEIELDRNRLVNEGVIRASKKISPVKSSETNFSLPVGWEWVKLGQLMEMFNGRAFKQSEWSDHGVPIVRIKNLNTESASFNYYNGTLDQKHKIDNGSFLISWSGTPGTSFGAFVWNRGPGALNQHINKCIIFGSSIDKAYLKLAVNSCMDHLIENAQGGAGLKHVTKGTLNNIVFGLPPAAEQRRIVAKVGELMALCDQLENQTEHSLDAHATLADTLLDALTQAQSAEELAENWQRLEQNWDLLFPTSIAGERAIDKLKQTILQLAVMGKLVPQDPNDEPASELLKQIAAEKEQLLKEKKIKKQKPLPPISAEEKLFELPEGWEWCRLDEPALHSEAGWSPKCPGPAREGCEWAVLKVSAVTWGSFNSLENKALAKGLLPRPEYEVKPRDFLISRANTADLVARSVVVPGGAEERLMMSDKIIRFVFSKLVIPDYLSFVNNSSQSREYYAKVAGGTSSSMKNVSRNEIQMLVLGLPPRKEQKRILDKLGELIPLCDQLKQRMQTAQKAQVNFTDAMSDQAVRQTA